MVRVPPTAIPNPIHVHVHVCALLRCISGGFRGVSEVLTEPPFGLHLVVRSADNRLTGTSLSGYRTKKTAAMAHLACFSRKFVQNPSIRLVGLVVLLKTIENGRGF